MVGFLLHKSPKKLYDKLVSHCTGISIIIHENVATGILTCGIFHECETLCETIDFFLKSTNVGENMRFISSFSMSCRKIQILIP